MPTDPDNPAPMHHLLKAYAKQRRDKAQEQAGMPLHPATRQLLQGEVRRQRPNPGRSPARPFAWLFAWPRLVFALGVLTILGVTLWTVMRTGDRAGEPLQFAKQTEFAAPGPADEQAAPVVGASALDTAKPGRSVAELRQTPPASDPSGGSKNKPLDARITNAFVLAKDMADGEALTLNPRTDSPAAPRAELRAAPAPAPTLILPLAPTPAARAVGAKTAQSPRTPAGATDAPGLSAVLTKAEVTGAGADPPAVRELRTPTQEPALSTPKRLGVASRANEGTLPINQTERYSFRSVSQTSLPTPAEPAPTAPAQFRGATQAGQTGTVLGSFQLEQSGDQVRVIDEDGSVYTGLLFAEGTGGAELKESVETTALQLRLLEDATAAKQSSQPVQVQSRSPRAPWVFRVNGTNKTLHEPVQLDGVLVPGAGVAAAAGPPTSSGQGPLSRRLASDRLQTATAGAAQRAPGNAPQPAAPSPTGAAATTSPAFPRQQLQSQAQGVVAAERKSSGFTNLSSIQRIQGTLRIGATNQFQVDAYRSAK